MADESVLMKWQSVDLAHVGISCTKSRRYLFSSHLPHNSHWKDEVEDHMAGKRDCLLAA